jgi:hypothetical protein
MPLTSIGKTFGKMKQVARLTKWTGERLGNVSRTGTSLEFNKLKEETDSRKKLIEKLHDALNMFHSYIGIRC